MIDPIEDRQFVIALARGLALLESFRAKRPLLTNQELSEATGLPRSSVSRLTHTLIKMGYLEFDSRRTGYRLGTKVLSLGHAMLGGMDLRPLVRPHMKDIAERIRGQAALATEEAYSMMVVDVVISPQGTQAPLEAGAHVGIANTAMGRAYFASCSAAEQKRIRQRLLARRQGSGGQVLEILAKAEADYRELGYCKSISDWQKDVSGVAVPLYLRGFGRRMVLTCGAPQTELSPQQIAGTVGPMMVRTAHSVEKVFERWIVR
ncbi:IclR family transcriptional regulator [Pigmentiphaga sp. H8]|uniref:IclR family transcriptional regulator n=1 Tax=Pigmentiphaga sp. H8 TaxID=2488560 RepID=UPI000F5B144A|nr:IclR family transcriptional regulator [Pigmentiphaga sp. H8]AZG07990.1 IclR family transcriptional regulator [Pigmentiphaga sp. H8]